jgi:integrase
MPRERTGYVGFDESRDQWFARITWTDGEGKRRNFWRYTATEKEARKLLRNKLREFEEGGAELVKSDNLLFRKVAEEYREAHLIEPIYRNGVRVAGQRSWKRQRGFLKTLLEEFGAKRIKAVTYTDLHKYKVRRLQTKTRRGGERSISHTHRELSLLRAILNYAQRSGYIHRNPFNAGKPLINPAEETKRTRILTAEEQGRLLDACVGRRAHLKPVILFALDTAMRRGEMMALQCGDLDFDSPTITLRHTTTKTLQARTVPFTERMKEALLRHRYQDEFSPLGELARRFKSELPLIQMLSVFGVTSGWKRSFETACELAGIEGVRFHDLRHTATTMHIARGVPEAQVRKITGHSQHSTFERYHNPDKAMIAEVTARLNEHQRSSGGEAEPVIH